MRLKATAALSAALLMATLTTSPVAAFSPSVAAARHYALAKIDTTQFKCLDALVMRESRWDPHAGHIDGYYGIAQTRPASRYGTGWRDDPLVQTKWMLRYIHGRYGSACQAWAWWQSHHWY